MRVCACTDFTFSYALYVHRYLLKICIRLLNDAVQKLSAVTRSSQLTMDAMTSTNWWQISVQRWARIDGKVVYIAVHKIGGKIVYIGERNIEKEAPHNHPLGCCLRGKDNAVTRLLCANKVAWLIRISALFAYCVVLGNLFNWHGTTCTILLFCELA